ncbi:MAG: L,D-transpeptidase family protein [Flavobacteriales bacterium]
MSTLRILFSFIILSMLFACQDERELKVIQEKERMEFLRQEIKDNFYSESAKFSTSDTSKLPSLISNLHSDSMLIWSEGKVFNKSALDLISITKNAILHGLDSNFYPVKELSDLYFKSSADTSNVEVLARGEFLFSKTALEFFTHLRYGVLNHEKKDSLYFQFKIDSLSEHDLKEIKNGIEKENLKETIKILEPGFVAYKDLQNAWSNYVSNQEFTEDRVRVKSLKEDSTDAYKRAKRALLLYQYIDSSDAEVDSVWIEKLMDFQENHGLKRDARIGRGTAYALSRSNEDRLLSVIASLEKLKWEKFEDDSLLYVNIPSYELKIIENNKIADRYRVVVGKTINRTPTFSADMKYLILNPFWHIPRSISSKEILPRLKKDSNHTKKKGYRIYDRNRKPVDASKIDWSKVTQNSFNYRISQTRSGGTALGKVKFIFTNKYSIYFHDTPSKRLFKNDIRAYSHGCVRVKDPLNLAAYLLSRQDPALTIDSVKNFVKTRRQKRHDLKYPLRVSIRYFSCEGSEDGKIIFFRDIYKKETELKQTFKRIFTQNLDKTNQ